VKWQVLVLVLLFLGGGSFGVWLAGRLAPESILAQFVGLFSFSLPFAIGLQSWLGAAIVVEVIRRLGLMDTNPKCQRGSASDLTLTDKLITTRTIENRLTGVSRLVVPNRAVVTPAVKDELKKHQIELVRQ
jgi:hypothetical protein